MSQGRAKEDIYKVLLGQGWTIDDIQKSFDTITKPSTPEAAVKKEENPKNAAHVIGTIGAVLVAAGIFSFIAANWEYMTRPLKLGVIVVAMLASYTLGWLLKERWGFEKTGSALLLLGALIYGAGIFLVAQMFNIRANWPDGFILWMLGCLVMGVAIESYPILTLGIIAGFVAVVGHPVGIFTSFSYNTFLMTSSVLLLIATACTFIIGYKLRKRMPEELKQYY